VGFLSLLLVALLSPVHAGPIQGAPALDPATYESITGDSVEDDHGVWDSFYKKTNHAFGKDPVGFLKEHLRNLKKGRAFVPAMGEGRNAIFLARNGFTVDGVDLSSVAVDRAVEEARSQNTSIKGIVADLFQFHYPKEAYDFVLVSLFYSTELMPKFKSALKKGGFLMLYLKLDTGRPSQKKTPDDFLVKASEVKSEVSEFEIIDYRVYRDHNEDVVAVLARKK
jgi:hypothetical protein